MGMISMVKDIALYIEQCQLFLASWCESHPHLVATPPVFRMENDRPQARSLTRLFCTNQLGLLAYAKKIVNGS